jgi:DNA-binding PucR family transcriptional regulator
VLVRTHRDDPGMAGATDVTGAMDAMVRRVLLRFTTVRLRCGVGGRHAGAAGLLASAGEAQAALAGARTGGHVNRAVPFDGRGLRRTLVEWYASETAQEAVASVLSPRASLGEAKSERLIETLHVYLDVQCSLSRTAERLSLHRNAVSYRIRQVFSMLDVERDNPDDLLLLQLACRARKLG